MRINHSLEWNNVSTQLRGQMQTAPVQCRKDLARMVGNVEALVQKLGQEEVEMRRNKKTHSPRHHAILEQIEASIYEFERWLVLAHLSHG
jgi:hypothetical protein